ncbi:LysE family translocator [Streptomyces sp. NPDC000941]
MAVGSVIAFWGVSFLLVLVPGADWAYAIAAGLRDRTVLPAVGGLLAGYVALTAVVAGGVATVVARSPLVLTVLTAVGAAYLVWLGIATLARPSAPMAGAEGSAGSWLRRAVKGAGISGLNPKALLLFLALLPQFIAQGATWPVAAQIALLGLVHTANCAAVYTGVGTAARAVLRARPAAARAVIRCSGAAMVAIGALLLVERLLS